jgi:addiction module HigA family antidote
MSKLFENSYAPESVSPPGDTLAELLLEKGMTPKELALKMGIPTTTIVDIIEAEAPITSEMAIHFEKIFGTTYEVKQHDYLNWSVKPANIDREI